ncbi:peptidoglycan-binding domain-containing protein [Ruegeria sp. 2205SS24-7]|uniref:peptidoglycan-binding domain-containing protein n=1 Tax=Ruegeria discodermiae TaxID=3064389 RepID=UPI002742302E|nr:peptidoglycan-binding domain-containing protein [Ruegeria sp. 2205SS24-7]MDP5218770.1 peptidoglycan-binding domain-containing protein [Ruegeria sp. 2205SS24-7]
MKKLKKGSKGSDVKTLQTTLNKTPPKAKLKIDGIFGVKTEAAVKAFQKAKRLKQDGIAGEKTLGALGLHKNKSQEVDWPWPEMDKSIRSNHKVYATHRRIVTAALKLAGKTKTAEMAALQKKMQAALKELNRTFLAQDKPARAVVVLERAFEKAKRDNPSACAGIVKKAKKLAETSVNAAIILLSAEETVEALAVEIKQAASNAPEPRPVEKTRKRITRYKSLGKADQKSMDKSLELCRRHSSPGVDAVRDKYLALIDQANSPGNSSVPQIMKRLVELEVLEIKYNNAIKSSSASELHRALHDLKLIDKTIGALEKARLVRLKQKAALDKELVKQVKASVFA